VKFTEHGEIVITARLAESDEAGLLLAFSVKDSGIGIAREQQEGLFRSFTQADASTTRMFGGTGLGLAIAKKLTGLMQGEIWVESTPGEGSVFHFTIRAGAAPVETLPAEPAESALPEGLRVLVVDDNASAREITGRMCMDMGCSVSFSSSGADALEMLERQARAEAAFDLVLMDWQMPGMTGLECVSAMRQRFDDGVAVIMVTAHGVNNVREDSRLVDLQVAKILSKPLGKQVLQDAIVAVTGGARHEAATSRGGIEPAGDPALSLAGARLLLVEDNAFNQELAVDLLTAHGIAVDVAENGRLALDALHDNAYDGILMDCQMPVMDGYTAARLIRKQTRWRALPIIAMTANVMAGDIAAALDAGMNDHIAKPLSINDMFATIARWVVPSEPVALRSQKDSPPSAGDIDIPEMACIDRSLGLARMNGNARLFLGMLRKFKVNQEGVVERIRLDWAAGEEAAAVRHAHTLKGIAGSIGAVRLSACSEIVERELAAGNFEHDRVDELERLLEEARNEIGELILQHDESAVRPPPTELPGREDLFQRLQQARERIGEYDTAGERDVQALLEMVPDGECRKNLQEAADVLERYDFDGALEALDRVQKSLA
jgi:CheY-like chemotaxis protein